MKNNIKLILIVFLINQVINCEEIIVPGGCASTIHNVFEAYQDPQTVCTSKCRYSTNKYLRYYSHYCNSSNLVCNCKL